MTSSASAKAAPGGVLPMIITRAGLALMGLADVLMLARHDPADLAALGLVEGTFGRLLDVCVAAVLSGLPVAGAAFAAGGVAALTAIWRRSMGMALVASLVLAAAALLARPILGAMGHSGPLAADAAALLPIAAAGAIAGLLGMACAVVLEAGGRAAVVARAVIAANLANLALNAMLIGGAGPFPAMGAAGCVLATALVRGGLMLALGLMLMGWLRTSTPLNTDRSVAARQWRACLAAIAIAGTMHAFGLCLTTIAGWQGRAALALYTACWAINLPAIIVVSGLGDALSLKAAQPDAGPLARLLRGPVLLVAGLNVLVLLAAPLIASAYGLGEPLTGQLAELLPLTLLVLGVDAAALLIMSALRGRQHFVLPAVIQIASMALAVPAAWWLAIGMANPLGIRGMVIAILANSLIKLGALCALTFFLSRAPGPRQPPLDGALAA